MELVRDQATSRLKQSMIKPQANRFAEVVVDSKRPVSRDGHIRAKETSKDKRQSDSLSMTQATMYVLRGSGKLILDKLLRQK